MAKAKALPTLDCNTQSRELIPFVPKTSVPVRPLKPRAEASLTWKPIRLHRVPRILARCLRHPRAPGIQLEPAASARATTPRRRGVSGRAGREREGVASFLVFPEEDHGHPSLHVLKRCPFTSMPPAKYALLASNCPLAFTRTFFFYVFLYLKKFLEHSFLYF